MVRVRYAQIKIMAPTAIKRGAKMKRSQCFRKNVFQSRKPKAKKQSMELSVEKCMYQYCHDPFFGGGHTLYFG
jgi:hypothetical protein